MIQKLLLNSQMIWMVFIKILKNTVQIKKQKIWIVFDDLIVDMLSNKKLNPIVTELFITGWKLNISLLLLHNFISLFQKLNQIQHTILLWKFQTKQNFNKLHLMALWAFIKSVLQNHIHFWLFIQLLLRIILYVLEKIL